MPCDRVALVFGGEPFEEPVDADQPVERDGVGSGEALPSVLVRGYLCEEGDDVTRFPQLRLRDLRLHPLLKFVDVTAEPLPVARGPEETWLNPDGW